MVVNARSCARRNDESVPITTTRAYDEMCADMTDCEFAGWRPPFPGDGRTFGEGLFGTCHFGGAEILGVEDGGYISFPGENGDYVSAPSATGAPTAITSDISLVLRVAADDWTPSAIQTIFSKWTNTGNQRAYRLDLNVAGTLGFFWSTTGADNPSAVSTVPVGATDGAFQWIGVVLDVNAGATRLARFWTSNDGVTWTQLGADVTAGVTSIFPSSAPLELSGHTVSTTQPFKGKVSHVRIYSGFDTGVKPGGTRVFSLDACADLPADVNAASFTASSGDTMTVNRSGSPATVLVPCPDCELLLTPAGCAVQAPEASDPAERLANLVPCSGGEC